MAGALTLVTLLLAFLSPGCARPGPADVQRTAESSPRAAAFTPTPGASLPETSLYHLEGVFEDQHGKPVRLEDMRGRPLLLAMIYSSCKGACPRIINDVKEMETKIRRQHPEGVGLVLVSFDPEVDTPDRLRQLMAEQDLDESWRLLRGSPELVRDLAALLNVKYRKVNEKDFAHSNLISVLDRDGVLVHQQDGLGADPAESLRAVDKLLLEAGEEPCCSESATAK